MSSGCLASRLWLIVATCVASITLCDAVTAAPVSRDAQAQCWSAPDLRALPGENIVQKVPQSRSPNLKSFSAPTPTTLSPSGPNPQGGAVRRVDLPRGLKLIALTFDFCEQPGEIAGYEGGIIDFLRQHQIKATLFVGGKWMATHPARTQQLLSDPLFEIASHGLAHRNTRLLTGADLTREITGPSTIYAASRENFATAQCAAPFTRTIASIPPAIRLFRFPFGACHPEGLAAVAAAGLTAIQWDVSTGDPAPTQSAQAIANTMITRAKPGSIIIAHANGRGHHTADALPLAIPKLLAQGFRFVTVGELMAAGKPVVTDTCYDAQPGDTDKYDTLFTKPKIPVAAPISAVPTTNVPAPTRARADGRSSQSLFSR
jgi:peptidoglycan-N-acetylglucosamine deacetylase